MAIKLGINGFGRIGRIVMRIAAQKPEEFEICGINLRKAEPEYMAYLLKYDSTFGRFPGTVEATENGLCVNGRDIPVFSCSDITEIPWDSCGAEYIIESTGAFCTTAQASGHLTHGARKVVITAPAKDTETPTYVIGVNHWEYDPKYNVVSNASCTTNCLAPLTKIVHDTFGIEQALMSTIHAATSKQKPIDGRAGRDWRTGRSVFDNIIPSTTGAAKACALVMPSLKGKITGMSFRVPSCDVSVVDLTARLSRPTTYKEICEAIEEASRTTMKGIVTYTRDEVVSADMRGESHTCIFDENAGIMLDDTFVKLIAWYDNEWGYSCKVLELVSYMAQRDAE